MVFHMKATLVIPDPIFRKLKQTAAMRGQTLSALVSELLFAGLRPPQPKGGRPGPLPSFDMGPFLVDIADREALYQAMEETQPGPRRR